MHVRYIKVQVSLLFFGHSVSPSLCCCGFRLIQIVGRHRHIVGICKSGYGNACSHGSGYRQGYDVGIRTRLKDLSNVRGDIAETLCGVFNDFPRSGGGRFDYAEDGAEWVQIVQPFSLFPRGTRFLIIGYIVLYSVFFRKLIHYIVCDSGVNTLLVGTEFGVWWEPLRPAYRI